MVAKTSIRVSRVATAMTVTVGFRVAQRIVKRVAVVALRWAMVLLVVVIWQDQTALADEAKTPASEASKWPAIQKILSTREFELTDVYSQTSETFCRSVFTGLRDGVNVEFVEPVVVADSYDDPALKPYRDRCPGVQLNKTETNYGAYEYYGTNHFKIFSVQFDSTSKQDEFVFYADEYKAPFPTSAQWENGGYTVYPMKNCKKYRYFVATHDAYDHYADAVKNNYNAIININGAYAVVDVEEWRSLRALPSHYAMTIWRFEKKTSSHGAGLQFLSEARFESATMIHGVRVRSKKGDT